MHIDESLIRLHRAGNRLRIWRREIHWIVYLSFQVGNIQGHGGSAMKRDVFSMQYLAHTHVRKLQFVYGCKNSLFRRFRLRNNNTYSPHVIFNLRKILSMRHSRYTLSKIEYAYTDRGPDKAASLPLSALIVIWPLISIDLCFYSTSVKNKHCLWMTVPANDPAVNNLIRINFSGTLL